MNKFFSIFLVAFVMASCANSGSGNADESVPSAPTTSVSAPAPLSDSGKAVGTTNLPVTTAPVNSNTAVALNPEHGAPGHNCSIPVGAPLNGAAAGSNPAPNMMNTQAPPQPANSNVRLNPAHGLPGHDCAIPVGQPLKS